MQSVLGAKAEKHGLTPEKHDGQLGVGILEREVDVAGGRGAEVRNLALYPDVAVLLLHQLAHPRHQLADGPDAARGARLVEAQAELVLEVGVGHKWIACCHCK